MDSSSAINTAVSGISASGGVASSISVSVLKSTENAQAQQIATLFSTIGLGQHVNAFA